MTVAVAHELVELAHDLARAVSEHDVERLEELLARSSRCRAPRASSTATAFLEAAAGPYEIDEFTYEEIDPEIYGNTAVLVSRYSQVARLDGRDLTHRMHVTDIWTRRDGALADRPARDVPAKRFSRRPRPSCGGGAAARRGGELAAGGGQVANRELSRTVAGTLGTSSSCLNRGDRVA